MIKVLSIKMSGFKNQKEEVSYELGNFNTISGKNGEGKTTLGEAIVYGLYGANLRGNEKADSILLNKESKQIIVELVIELNGDVHTLRRRRKVSSEITLDGRIVTQAELSQMLPPKELFLAVYSPEYFLSMGETDSRNFIIKYLPQINKEDVLAKIDPFYVGYLVNRSFSNPNSLLKELREELKEKEKDLAFSEGSLTTKKGDLRDFVIPEPVSFDDSLLKDVENMLKNLREKESPMLLDVEFLKEEKMELERKITILRNTSFSGELKDVQELENEKSKMAGIYSTLISQRDKILDGEGVCPTCMQSVSKEHLEEQRNLLEKEIADVAAKGSDLAKKIQEVKEYNENLVKNYEDEKNKKIDSLEKQILDLNIEYFEEENEKTIKKFKEQHKDEIAFFESELDKYREEKSKADMANARYQMAVEAKAKLEVDIQSFEKDLDRAKDKVKDINMTIEAVAQYNAAFVKIQSEFLSQNLNKVSINLQKLVKTTGELKDAFEILYEGKELRIISTGEKVKAWLEISELFMRLGKTILPVFIDNAEGVTDYDIPNTQVIEARVVKEQKLKVDII